MATYQKAPVQAIPKKSIIHIHRLSGTGNFQVRAFAELTQLPIESIASLTDLSIPEVERFAIEQVQELQSQQG